jgi:hypothetical protein
VSPTEFRPPPSFRKPVNVGQRQNAGQIRLEMAGMLELTGLSHCNPIFYISQELLHTPELLCVPPQQMMWGACVPNLHTMSKCWSATMRPNATSIEMKRFPYGVSSFCMPRLRLAPSVGLRRHHITHHTPR